MRCNNISYVADWGRAGTSYRYLEEVSDYQNVVSNVLLSGVQNSNIISQVGGHCFPRVRARYRAF